VGASSPGDGAPTTSCPPSFAVVVPLEGRARVVCDAQTEGELERLNDWLRARPDWLELVQAAVDLADRDRAA
jgi:hypothetical protein